MSIGVIRWLVGVWILIIGILVLAALQVNFPS